VLVAGTRGYAFTGDGTFGGLLAAGTWPTTFGGPTGYETFCTLEFRGLSGPPSQLGLGRRAGIDSGSYDLVTESGRKVTYARHV
jgi:hypothetical protein